MMWFVLGLIVGIVVGIIGVVVVACAWYPSEVELARHYREMLR